MSLYEKQLKLQQATIEEFETQVNKKIEKQQKKRKQNLDDTFQNLYLKRLAFKITELRDEKLPKIIEKLFIDKKYRDDIVALYAEGELKDSNLKAKAKRLAPFLQEHINTKTVYRFENPKKEDIESQVANYIYKVLKEKSRNLDSSLVALTKQKEQVFTLATVLLSSGEIAWLSLKSIAKLLEKDFGDEEDSSTTQQAIINSIAEELFEHIAFRFKKEHIDIEDWENTTEIDIGETPFSFLMELHILEEFDKGDSSLHLHFSEEFKKKSKTIYNSMLTYLPPSYEPMIVTPLNWTTIDDGGFLKDENSSPKYDLYVMKTTTKKDKKNLLTKRDTFSSKLLDAINIIQQTKWQINSDIIEDFENYYSSEKEKSKTTLKEIKQKKKIAKITFKEKKIAFDAKKELLKEMGLKDEDIDKKLSSSKTEFFEINKIILSLDKEQKKIEGNLNIKEKIVSKAKKYLEYEEIFFVWQVDFRGRVYPVQPLLNPQGEDFAKSLLRFAERKPLGENGEYWFKVHGANVYGEDKISFADRVKWVDTHTEDILSIFEHKNRWESEFLQKADKSFSFLAFAYEFKSFIENPQDFRSAIPIAMDGSNNGFQHITALLRDLNGAQKVNVLPTQEQIKPNDIYKDIAIATQKLIDKDSLYRVNKEITIDAKYIDTIYPHITRSFTKKNVMTEVYGAGKDAKLTQNREYIKEKLNKELQWDDTTIDNVAKYITAQITKAMKKELSSSDIYKKWMKKIVKEIAKQNRAIQWRTPLIGLEVLQEDFELKEDRIATKYNGKTRTIQIQVPTTKISQKELTKGIAPNFIHSLDATHLFLTVLLAKKEGINSFATIHDSFGTHACDIEKLNKSIRDSFVEMFNYDILAKFKEEIEREYMIEVEDIKYQDRENFDIENIYKSEYFFS